MTVRNSMYKIKEQEDNSCPCDALVRLTAESVAEELCFAIGRIIDCEVGSRFICLLDDMHQERNQTNLAIEMLYLMMQMIQSKRSIALMELLQLADEGRAEMFMNIFIEEAMLSLCTDED